MRLYTEMDLLVSPEQLTRICGAVSWAVPWGGWALSLGSIPALRTQLPAHNQHHWAWGAGSEAGMCCQMSPAAQQSGWLWITDILIFISSASSVNVTGSVSLGFFVRSFDKILNYLGLNQICIALNTAAGGCPSRSPRWNSLVERWAWILLICEHWFFGLSKS